MAVARRLGAEEAGHGAGTGEAGSDGGPGYAPRVGRARVGGQSMEAEIRVTGADARRADEILRPAVATGGGGGMEEQEDESDSGEHGGNGHW